MVLSTENLSSLIRRWRPWWWWWLIDWFHRRQEKRNRNEGQTFDLYIEDESSDDDRNHAQHVVHWWCLTVLITWHLMINNSSDWTSDIKAHHHYSVGNGKHLFQSFPFLSSLSHWYQGWYSLICLLYLASPPPSLSLSLSISLLLVLSSCLAFFLLFFQSILCLDEFGLSLVLRTHICASF